MIQTLQQTSVESVSYEIFFLGENIRTPFSEKDRLIWYLIVVFRFNPAVDIPTGLDQSKTVCSQNLKGYGLVS